MNRESVIHYSFLPTMWLFPTKEVVSSSVPKVEPTDGGRASRPDQESSGEVGSENGVDSESPTIPSHGNATDAVTIPVSEVVSMEPRMDKSPSLPLQVDNTPSMHPQTNRHVSPLPPRSEFPTSSPTSVTDTHDGHVIRAQASNTSITSLGFDLNSYYKPYLSSPRVISKPVTRWISGPEHFQDYMNSVFIPRQEANMKNERKHIVYVKRGTTGIAGQMAGMCDVLLTAITNDRVFQCISAVTFDNQITLPVSLPTSSISRSSTSPFPLRWREIQVFPSPI